MQNIQTQKKGFSIIELLIVIAILGIITIVTIQGLSLFKKRQAILVNRDLVISVLSKAKSDTLSSLNSKAYGVHFDIVLGTMTIFEAPTYVNGANGNQVFSLDYRARFTSISTLNDSREIVFSRLTGSIPLFSYVNIGTFAGDSVTVEVTRTGIISYY